MSPTSDLELNIYRRDQQMYAVDFRYTDSDPENQVDVRLGAKQQALVSLDLEKLNSYLLVGDTQQYSHSITASLFADESLRTAFAQARAITERSEAMLRVRLAIGPSAIELHSLRWEMLNDPQTGLTLSTDQNIYFSRYLSSLDWRTVRLRPRGELKALAVIAAPDGLDQYQLAKIDRDLELTTIQDALGNINLSTLERSVLDNIVTSLTNTHYDILYIVAHGTMSRGDTYLWLEDDDGKIQRVSGAELITRLQELENRPRLIVLKSCQSAGKGEGDVLSALGPRLAEIGIPAVLAMQDNISIDTAAKLMPTFFNELQKDGRIDRALNVARGQVRHQQDWWVPVLFMRLKSGRLWYIPGFGGPRGEFGKWPSLLQGLQSGCCTPILGPGLLDAFMGSVRDLAQQWAEELQYPLAAHERESLPQVAQFRSVDQSRFTAESEWLALMRNAIRKRVKLPDELNQDNAPVDQMLKMAGQKLQGIDEFESHRILAKLPVRVYITANTDEMLESALRAAGRIPMTMVCPWREFSEETDPTMYTKNDEYDPTPGRPLVYHLFGLLSQPESLVLTEDDTFEFLIGITRHMKNIPDQVGRALADSALLFLGFQTDEWTFRVLLHTLLATEGNTLLRRHAHIAAQIEPEEGRLLNPGRARRYLETYFARSSEIEINIYWGSARDFLKELSSKLDLEKKA